MKYDCKNTIVRRHGARLAAHGPDISALAAGELAVSGP